MSDTRKIRVGNANCTYQCSQLIELTRAVLSVLWRDVRSSRELRGRTLPTNQRDHVDMHWRRGRRRDNCPSWISARPKICSLSKNFLRKKYRQEGIKLRKPGTSE